MIVPPRFSKAQQKDATPVFIRAQQKDATPWSSMTQQKYVSPNHDRTQQRFANPGFSKAKQKEGMSPYSRARHKENLPAYLRAGNAHQANSMADDCWGTPWHNIGKNQHRIMQWCSRPCQKDKNAMRDETDTIRKDLQQAQLPIREHPPFDGLTRPLSTQQTPPAAPKKDDV